MGRRARRARLVGHYGTAVGLAELPGGRLISAGMDGAVRAWDLARADAPAPLAGLSVCGSMPSREVRGLHRDGDAAIARIGGRAARIARDGRAAPAPAKGISGRSCRPRVPQRSAARLRRRRPHRARTLAGVAERVALEAPALAVGLLDERTAVVLDGAGHVMFYELG